MTKVCHNTSSAIYDDGDNWVWKSVWKSHNEEDYIYPKATDPLFPLAAVVKWEMTPDDEKILDELRKKARKA